MSTQRMSMFPYTWDTVKTIWAFLSARNIRWLPVPGHCIRKTVLRDAISVPSLRRIILCVHGRTTAGGTAVHGHYLNDAGMLSEISASPDRFPDACRDAGIRLLTDGTVHRYRTVKAIRDGMLLPDRINKTRICLPALSAACDSVSRQGALNSETPVPDDMRYFGNCVITEGMTAEQFIQAAYAVQALRYSAGLYGAVKPAAAPPVWSELESMFIDDEKDIWHGERLRHSPGLPFTPPDPGTYAVLTKINTPSIERETGNGRSGTFDFVRVLLGLRSTDTFPDRTEFIRSHRRDLVKIALTAIHQTPRYCEYDVPVTYLKIAKMTITRQSELELLFELKTPVL